MVDNLRFFAGAARMLEGKCCGRVRQGYTSLIRREPLGIVARHHAVELPADDGRRGRWARLSPPGNVQIIKPAEQTPLTTLRFAELAAGRHPARCAPGDHRRWCSRGRHPRQHPDIALVSLTGDTSTGKLIAANAADSVKRVHLELGGKAPMVVLDDADPAAVAEAVKLGGYFNSGQDCTASSRILVNEPDLRRRALGPSRRWSR